MQQVPSLLALLVQKYKYCEEYAASKIVWTASPAASVTSTKAQILTHKARLGLSQSTPEAHAAIWDGKGITFRATQRGCTVDAVAVRISAVVVVKGVSVCTFVPVKQVN